MRKNCILLAGGKSSRMGQDKLELEIFGKTLFQNAIDNLSPYFDKIIVASKERQFRKWSNVVFVEDTHKNIGPLAGILSGLKISDTNYNFVTTSDTLYFNKHLINLLYENISDFDCVTPLNDRNKLEPLYSIYSKNCIEYIENQIKIKNFKVSNLIHSVNFKTITFNDWSWYVNINTPEEYLKAIRKKD